LSIVEQHDVHRSLSSTPLHHELLIKTITEDQLGFCLQVVTPN
jgi:hypothetical protein